MSSCHYLCYFFAYVDYFGLHSWLKKERKLLDCFGCMNKEAGVKELRWTAAGSAGNRI